MNNQPVLDQKNPENSLNQPTNYPGKRGARKDAIAAPSKLVAEALYWRDLYVSKPAIDAPKTAEQN